jgi:hypothetical protein
MKYYAALLLAMPVHASIIFSASTTTQWELTGEITDSCSFTGRSPVQCGLDPGPGGFGSLGETQWLYAVADAEAGVETGYSFGATASFAGSLTITGRTGSGIAVFYPILLAFGMGDMQYNPPPNRVACPPAIPDWPCFAFQYGEPIPISAYVSSGPLDEASDNRAAVIITRVDVVDGTGRLLKKFSYTDGFDSDVLDVSDPPMHAPEPGYGFTMFCVLIVSHLIARSVRLLAPTLRKIRLRYSLMVPSVRWSR